jgi:hypothetical protein
MHGSGPVSGCPVRSVATGSTVDYRAAPVASVLVIIGPGGG